MTQRNPAGPLVLCILDGWGIAPAGPDNAILSANTPVWRSIDPLPIVLGASPVTEESDCDDPGTMPTDTEAHLPI